MSTSNAGDTHMPLKDTVTTETDLNDNPARLRIFEQDSDLAAEIVRDVKPVMPDITIQTVLRDAVHNGLPLVRKKLLAMCEAAKQAK